MPRRRVLTGPGMKSTFYVKGICMSKVVIVRSRLRGRPETGGYHQLPSMFRKGFECLTGRKQWSASPAMVPDQKNRIGIKINTIGGRMISTLPETSLTLAKVLAESGIEEKNLIIWDRTNRELKEAGHKLNIKGNSIKVFGTDTQGVGYSSGLLAHLNIGSLFSLIQSRHITASISLAILKDHGLAGVTAGMKNYFGAIHNPNKYHDNHCDPYIAELFDSSLIKSKHRMTILDALTIQFHRGPSYHAEWADNYGALIFSKDPVAADRVGWQIIEKLRAAKGLPTLKEEHREPVYLHTADRMGLGTANLNKIQLIETEV